MPTLTDRDITHELQAWRAKAHKAEANLSLPAARIAWTNLDRWLDALNRQTKCG